MTTSWLPQQSSVSQAYICAPKACVWSQYKTAVLGKRLDSLQDSSNLNNWVNIRNLDLVVEESMVFTVETELKHILCTTVIDFSEYNNKTKKKAHIFWLKAHKS